MWNCIFIVNPSNMDLYTDYGKAKIYINNLI